MSAPGVRARIVHLSDLHFGGGADARLLDPLRVLLADIQPTFLVVSGDVVNSPRPRSVRTAAKYLESVRSAAGVSPERVIVVPGNHDYKVLGLFGLRRLTRVPFEVYFRREGLSLAAWRRWRLYARLMLSALWPWSRDLQDQLIVHEDRLLGVVFLCFNSTPPFEWFGLATGCVQPAVISEASRWCAQTRTQALARIAVVHHHPVPIPYVGTTARDRLEESFMVFYNAGAFLRELGRGGVDLVLHGHKHFSGLTRVSYDLPDGSQAQLGVLAAGSALHQEPSEPLGNEFNVITLLDDGTIGLDQWYYSADIRRRDESRHLSLRRLTDVRERRRWELRDEALHIEVQEKTETLTRSGYTNVEMRLHRCRPPGTISKWNLGDLLAERPAYIRDVALVPTVNPRFSALVIDQAKTHLRSVVADIELGEDLRPSDGPFDIGYSYRLLNCHALSELEFRRKYPRSAGGAAWEYATASAEDWVDLLRLTVEFPSDLDLDADIDDFGAQALYVPYPPDTKPSKETLRTHDEETARVRRSVRRTGRALVLEITQPVPTFAYRIRWRYKRKDSVSPSLRRAGQLRHLRNALIKSARDAAGGSPNGVHAHTRRSLLHMAQDVAAPLQVIDPGEILDISLSITEDDTGLLRFVAASTPLPELYAETLYPGEGCAGFCFEKGRVLFYNRSLDDIGYFISGDELRRERGRTALRDYETLIAVPWIDRESGLSVGVISIGSTSTSSRFLPIFDMPSRAQEGEASRLLELTGAFAELLEDGVSSVLRLAASGGPGNRP